MSYFIPAGDAVPNFEGSTLVLPALSLGNIGQLTIDLLIPSFNIPLVGYIDDDNVLPCAGNDAYTKRGSGVLCANLEVYHSSELKLTLLQQRAPVSAGRNALFVANVLKWAQDAKVKQIVLLLSSDAAYRTPQQIDSAPFRFVASKALVETPKLVQPLEEDSYTSTLKIGTVAQKLYAACNESAIPLLTLVMFCSEGDNIPDAISMGTVLSDALSLRGQSRDEPPRWVLPSSWAALMQGNQVDRFLFG